LFQALLVWKGGLLLYAVQPDKLCLMSTTGGLYWETWQKG